MENLVNSFDDELDESEWEIGCIRCGCVPAELECENCGNLSCEAHAEFCAPCDMKLCYECLARKHSYCQEDESEAAL